MTENNRNQSGGQGNMGSSQSGSMGSGQQNQSTGSQSGQQQRTSTSGAEGEQETGRSGMSGNPSGSDMERQGGMGSQEDMGGERVNTGGTAISEDDEDLGGRVGGGQSGSMSGGSQGEQGATGNR